MQEKRPPRWKLWQLPLILAAMVIVIRVMGDDASQWLRYEYTALQEGQVWRLFTAHLVHLGWSHLMLNLAALFIIWALVGEAMSRLGWLLLAALSSCLTIVALWLFYPYLQWYVGLSGLLHGLLFAGALVLFGYGDRGGAVLALLVIVKLVWEQLLGPLPGSEAASGGAVIVEAHLYGALSGGLFVALIWSRPDWRARLFLPWN